MIPLFPQGRVSDNLAPGRNKPKCPDCGHDIRLQHHTTAKSRGFRLGYCIKCKAICPTIVKMFDPLLVPQSEVSLSEGPE